MSTPILNRRMILETPTRVPDGAGGFVEEWSELGQLWAEVKPGTGRERDGRFLTVSRVPYRITVRSAPVGADARPRADQRFREGVRIFNILAVTEKDPSGRYLTCFAEEEQSA